MKILVISNPRKTLEVSNWTGPNDNPLLVLYVLNTNRVNGDEEPQDMCLTESGVRELRDYLTRKLETLKPIDG